LGASDPAALASRCAPRAQRPGNEALVRRRGHQPRPARRTSDADSVALERSSYRARLRVTLAAEATRGSLTVHYATLDQLTGC